MRASVCECVRLFVCVLFNARVEKSEEKMVLCCCKLMACECVFCVAVSVIPHIREGFSVFGGPCKWCYILLCQTGFRAISHWVDASCNIVLRIFPFILNCNLSRTFHTNILKNNLFSLLSSTCYSVFSGGKKVINR